MAAIEAASNVGDLLADFDLVEQGLSPWEKSTVTLTHSQYGRRLFVIPNPVNNTWMMKTYSRTAGRNPYQMTDRKLAQLGGCPRIAPVARKAES